MPKEIELHVKIKNHNNTVYAKNNMMTCILKLNRIDLNEIDVDDDFNTLIDDLSFIIDRLKGSKNND